MRPLAGATCGPCVLIASLLTMSLCGAPKLAAPKAQAKQTKRNAALSRAAAGKNLHLIGGKISKAVLDKDIAALLAYDRTDLHANDEISLQNPKSDLYCYLFNSDCITWGDGSWRSIYDKLSQAHPLEIKVRLARLPSDHQLYGSLLFYDGSSVSDKDLESSEFLCKEAPAKIASWKFRMEKGKWKPVTPLFDAETEGLCPQ